MRLCTVQKKINKTKLSRSIWKHPICSRNICDQNIYGRTFRHKFKLMNVDLSTAPKSIFVQIDQVQSISNLIQKLLIHKTNYSVVKLSEISAFYVLDTWQHKCLFWPWFFYWYCTIYIIWVVFFSMATGEFQVYTRRWIVLAIFTLYSASNALQWIQYSIIANVVER